jgi:hypothetical protein
MIGRVSEYVNVTVDPPQHSVVRDIAPDQIIAISEVHRSFGPEGARIEPLYPTVAKNQEVKGFIIQLKVIANAESSFHA